MRVGGDDTERGRVDLGWLTPEVTMVVITFLAVFWTGARLRIDTDVWWHLRIGEYTLHHGAVRNDFLSYTRLHAGWIDHSWGANALSYLAWSVGGYGALEILTGLCAVAAAVFLYLMCAGGTYLRCVAVGLASVTASVFWGPRPQMVTYVLTAAVLYILFLCRHRDRNVLWILPLILLVWANLHGGFAFGLFLIFGTLVGESFEQFARLDERGRLGLPTLRRLGLWGLLSVAVTVVNPYGPRLLTVPVQTFGGGYGQLIQEWAPPDLHIRGFWPFAAMLVLLLLTVGASPRRLGWTDGLLCSAAALLAMTASRNISLFALVTAPVIAYHASAICEERGWAVRPLKRASRPVIAVDVVILLIAAVVAGSYVSAPYRSAFDREERQELPVDAISYLREHGVRGRLFNTYDWGGYVIHALPGVPVFVDGRTDLYGASFLRDPYQFIAGGGPGWQQKLDSYRIGTVLVHRTDGIASVLGNSPAWRTAYVDGHAIVFERRL